MRRVDFEDLSLKVWEFLRDAPFKPREETVTEGLLTRLHRDFGGTSVVSKASSAQETAGGHDWLWAITSPITGQTMHMRVQAKMLFGAPRGRKQLGPQNVGDGNYNELGTSKKRNKKARQQCEKLMKAQRANQLPVYAFFNSEAMPFGTAGTSGIRLGCGRTPFVRNAPATARSGRSTPSASPLGVTLADARWVRFHLNMAHSNPMRSPRWPITPATLNPGAIPWECITCDLAACLNARPNQWGLAQARRVLNSPAVTAGSVLGISPRPQNWARRLRVGDVQGAWSAANTIQEALDNSVGVVSDDVLYDDDDKDLVGDFDETLADHLDRDDADQASDTAPAFLVFTTLSEDG